MPKSCLDGYLTDECAKCVWWRDGSDPGLGIGCGAPFRIFECEAFAAMVAEEEADATKES